MAAADLLNFLPHKLVQAALLRRVFMKFAHANGLVYIGLLLPTDDYEPVRGFTANANQTDNHVVHGSVHGREVTVLERTVTHSETLQGKRSLHSHTWLIAAVRHDAAHSPGLLLLSHDHPRLHDEAVAIHHSKSQHITLEYTIDAKFLVYGKPSAADDFRQIADNEFVDLIVDQSGFDYEISADTIYVYSHSMSPSEAELTHVLNTAVALANAYEKSPA